MEVFRQYAEHYRKIVTEINERKNYRQEQQNIVQEQNEEQPSDNTPDPVVEEKLVAPIVQTPMPMKKKSFKIVEIKEKDVQEKLPEDGAEKVEQTTEVPVKTKRIVRRKKTDSNESEAV